MSGVFHAPARVAFCGRAITLQLLLPDEGHDLVPVSLRYETGVGKKEIRMLPTDGYTEREAYVLYSATVPAEDMQGDVLRYTFSYKKHTTKAYQTPLVALPVLPPFIISEFATELRDEAHYYELCNPGDTASDLYDYELLLELDGEVVGRNPLADRRGENVLQGGEVAIFRYVTAARLNEYGSAEADSRAALEALERYFPETCEGLTAHPPRILTAVTAVREGECYVDAPFTFAITQNDPHRLLLVPRGGAAADAIYVVRVNMNRDSRDVPARTSSVWTIDFCHPSLAVRTDTRRSATPGFADDGQVFPYVGDTVVPVVLPLGPTGSLTFTGADIPVRFAVLGGQTGAATVHVKTKTGTRAFAAHFTDDGVYEARLPAMILMDTPDKLSYYVTVRGGLYEVSQGSENTPLTVRVIDNAGPVITGCYPAQGEAIENDAPRTVSIAFCDPSGVNLRTSTLFFDGCNVSADAKWRKGGVTLRLPKDLTLGEHVVELTLRDMLGNRTYRRIAFHYTDGKQLNFYRGEVHAHTLESDGMGTPEEAMAYARDVGRVDYFAVTDHCCYLVQEDVDRQRRVADSFNENGKFAALYGYEASWGNDGFWGHMNVLNAPWFAAADKHTLYELYEKLAADENAIAMFNHPCDRWGDFDSFGGHTPVLDKRLCLAEIKRAEFDHNYAVLLSRGWHAAPVANEDNHKKDWTTKTTGTGVVLAHSLTRENVLDAFRRGRTYSTTDNTMRIRYRVNGAWLGARLSHPAKLTAEIDVTTEREEGIGDLCLVAEDNIVVASVSAGAKKEFSWRVELEPDFDYYYVRIRNGNTYAVTSPVFVEGRDALSITEMRVGVSEDEKRPHAVSVTVRNDGKTDLAGTYVDLYLTDADGFAIRSLAPFESVNVGALKVGESRTVCRYFPCLPHRRRVSAVAVGMAGKRRFADTRYVMLTPALINSVSVLTSPANGEKNPFAFAEIYNPTCVALPLDGYVLNVRHMQGDFRPNYCVISPLDGVTLPPRGTLTVWQRPKGSTLTVQDFNARYGTFLREGEDLLVTEQPLFVPNRTGHLLDLCLGDEHLTRAAYGDYCGGALPVADRPSRYRALHDVTIREERYEPEFSPLGIPDATQRLDTMEEAPCRPRRKESPVTESRPRERVLTKLTRVPLVPFHTVRLVADTLATVKTFLKDRK